MVIVTMMMGIQSSIPNIRKFFFLSIHNYVITKEFC